MLLEVVKPEVTKEAEDSSESAEFPELSIIYKINNETIDTFMPTKTCLYGKHIVTLFFPISKVIENSSNTFSMYLKISTGTVKIGEAQIRATISGQDLRQDWETGMDASISMRILGLSILVIFRLWQMVLKIE